MWRLEGRIAGVRRAWGRRGGVLVPVVDSGGRLFLGVDGHSL